MLTKTWTLPVAIALVLFASSAAVHAASAASDEEDSLIRRGIQLRKARDDLAARAEFQKAYDLTHSPKAAAQLGLAEFALGRWDDAEAHVSEALRAPRDPWIAKYRTELDESLATIKTHVAHVEVIGEPAGAEAFVNGRSVGRVPLAAPVAVSEGQVDIELRAAGFVRGSRTLTVQGGQYQRVVVRLEAAPATTGRPGGTPGTIAAEDSGAAAASANAARQDTDDGSRREDRPNAGESFPGDSPSMTTTVIKWTALGLAAAGLATGIAATVVYSNNITRFESLHDGACMDHGGRAVDSGDHPIADCQPSLDAARSARKWQIAGFVGAGVFSATWLVLTLTQRSGAPVSRTSGNLPGGRAAQVSWDCVPAVAAIAGATCTFRF